MNHGDLAEVIVIGVLVLSRLWSHLEHRKTDAKVQQVHVLVNGNTKRLEKELEEALARIKHLEEEIEGSHRKAKR